MINYMSATVTLDSASVVTYLKVPGRGITVSLGEQGLFSVQLTGRQTVIQASVSAHGTSLLAGCPVLARILLVLRVLRHLIKPIVPRDSYEG